jgi:superfamily II DNA or RNA helicase
MKTWKWADAETVRGRVAAAILHEQTGDARLGDIVLRDHQRDAADRLRRALEKFGGALLADEVGLGKTYTALAVARAFASRLIVAPAALTPMWKAAVARCALSADVISFETLSRRELTYPHYDLVLVDEAHHARNPLTRRYSQLASVTRAARVLLLTATPVHNASDDLTAVLALFLGSRAQRLTPAERAACVVRRTRNDIRDVPIPERSAPAWCNVDGSVDVLRSLTAIPAPCPPRDGGVASALVTLSLVRSWASTEAALRSALRRRIAKADALTDALSSGRYPSRAELRAWVVGDDATQLAFPELVVESVDGNTRALLEAVRRHADGARHALATTVRGDGDVDRQRAGIIREIRDRHRGERIVVFSQYAESVHEMFTRLRHDGGVAAVTANGATVAGGPLTRTQALDRFAPVASGARTPSRAEAIELLIATDLLSEGLNLQDASVVIHLDLPWTAARLTQRMGRVWRIASPHAKVHEYAIAPPAPAEDLLHLTQVLTQKAAAAWSSIGESLAPLLASTRSAPPQPPLDRAAAEEAVRRTLRAWIDTDEESAGDATILAVGVHARSDGWLAAIVNASGAQLIACRTGEHPSSDPRVVAPIAQQATGAPCVAAPARVDRALADLDAYLEAARAAADVGVSAVGSHARAVAASRISALAAAAPAHRRVATARLAARARVSVARSRSAGAERLLAALVASRTPDDDAAGAAETWLERVVAATESSTPNAEPVPSAEPPRVVALVVLVGKQTALTHTPEAERSR